MRIEDLENNTLILSDDKVFYTIEGEGEYIGQPSIFVRLAMCNLTCKGFASEDSPHGCDSYVSWSVKNRMTFKEIWDEFFDERGLNYAMHLVHGAILKLTGGEPLVQQKNLILFHKYLKLKVNEYTRDISPFRTDFETNATIKPHEYWLMEPYVTFTTSPKLSTNGDPEKKSYQPEAIQWHVDNGSGFKFVITRSEDIDEIWRKYVDKFNIPLTRIWFMPCCGSREEHIENAPAVAEYAKQLHVNFSPRLQLLIWNKALLV
jgi:7-carboxy-7-deazaguanine synthase